MPPQPSLLARTSCLTAAVDKMQQDNPKDTDFRRNFGRGVYSPYSTVTLLAKFRGRSTLQPRKMAM